MRDTPPEALLERARRAEQRRDMFASLMQDCYAYAMPERDAWSSYGYGSERQVLVYDSTAVIAVGHFANRLQNALFPPQQRWATLTLDSNMAALDGAADIQRDLEAATDAMFRAIHASNFDQAINEWAQDLAAGVGCLLIEDGRAGQRRMRGPVLRFQAIPAALVAFDDGPHGTVEGVFFNQVMPARLLLRTYPDATLPTELARRAEAEPDAQITLLQATTYDAADDSWRFEVLERASRTRLLTRRYRTCPWVVTRWTRAPGETHGRGPLTQALPDIRTLNKLMELLLQSASIGTAGMWTALDDGVLNPNTLRLVPGAIIPVQSNGGPRGPSLAPLKFPGDVNLSEAMIDKLRTSVRRTLFDDPLPPEVQVGLTATEVIERVRRFQADTGAFGRLQADALMPLVHRVVDILEQAGAFAGLQQLSEALRGDYVRIQATSPLAQAQDRADVQAVMQVVQGMAALGPAGAAMLPAAIDLERAGRFVAVNAGVPQALIPTEQELAAAREAAAAQAEAAMLAQSPAAAQVAGAVASAAMREPTT